MSLACTASTCDASLLPESSCECDSPQCQQAPTAGQQRYPVTVFKFPVTVFIGSIEIILSANQCPMGLTCVSGCIIHKKREHGNLDCVVAFWIF